MLVQVSACQAALLETKLKPNQIHYFENEVENLNIITNARFPRPGGERGKRNWNVSSMAVSLLSCSLRFPGRPYIYFQIILNERRAVILLLYPFNSAYILLTKPDKH